MSVNRKMKPNVKPKSISPAGRSMMAGMASIYPLPSLICQAGFESLFWGRMDYQDRNMRYNKQAGTNG